MANESWTDRLRQRLAEHQEAPPEGLWDDIRDSLDKTQAKPARTVPLRKWAAAAAVTALIVGGAAYLYNLDVYVDVGHTAGNYDMTLAWVDDDDTDADDFYDPNAPQKGLWDWDDDTVPAGNADEKGRGAANGGKRTPVTAAAALDGGDAAQPMADAMGDDDTQVADVCKDEPAQVADAHKGNNGNVQGQGSRNLPGNALLADDGWQVKPHATAKHGLGLNLYASNNVINTDGLPTSNPGGGFYRAAATVKREQHHEQPLSFGLTASYPVSARLSLTTGVVYTWLKSDFTFTTKTSQYVDKQTLHYIGVPLNVSATFLDNGKLSAYAVGGGQVDFNIKARTQRDGVTHDSEKDDPQFSVNLGVGAQYQLLPFMGIYVEPMAKYYFDNESDVSNAFKEHPLKFNLQAGLRFNLK